MVAEAEDVDAGELGRLSRRCELTQPTRVRTGSRPASRDEIAIGEHEIDSPPEVGERAPELLGDPRLPGCSGSSLRRTKIVTHVVIGEDLCGEPYVPTRPHFLVEAHDELLVHLGVHQIDDPSDEARNHASLRRVRCRSLARVCGNVP